MILEQETFNKLGYYPSKLSKGSNKIIYSACDFCGEQYEVIYRNYFKTLTPENPKCACKKCRHLKAKITNKIKFGEEVPARIKEIQEKTRKTNLKRHGVEYSSQSLEVKEKVKRTNLNKTKEEKELQKQRSKESFQKRFGVDNYSQTREWKEKIKEAYKDGSLANEQQEKYKKTCIEKFGVENVFQSEEIKEKIKQTNIEIYGCEFASQNEDIKKKIKDTIKEVYGVDSFNSLPEIQEKKKQTSIKTYGYEHPTQSPEIKLKTRETCINKGLIKTYDGKLILEWAEEKGISRTHAGALLKNYGSEFFEKYEKNTTDIELILEGLLIKNNIIYKKGLTIEGTKSDFLINNVLVEVDGLFWHSDFNQLPKKYHEIKKEHYEKLGYKPLFFRSDEIIYKTEIVESILLNSLNLITNKIGARKCEIKKVGAGDAQIFFEENHLMSTGRGISYGLYHENTLVSAIQLYNKGNNIYEISRFCNKKLTSIQGGFSKLLSYFEKEYNPKQIFTFIDCRYGFGEYLPSLGFKFTHKFLSFKWTNGKICYHRMVFPGNSGYDNKLAKIWDCGQAKFIKEL